MPAPQFVAVGQEGQRISSADGRNWSQPQLGKEGEYYRAVSYGNGRFVTVGTFGGSNIFASSADGQKWEHSKKDGQYKLFVRGLTFGNGQFIAVGGEPVTVGSSSPFVLLSADGAAWSDYVTINGNNILRRIAFGGGRFVGVGDRGRRSQSPDGKTWTDVAQVRPLDTLIDIAFGNGVFVGVGLHGLRMTTRDGVAWSAPIPGEEGEHLNSVVWAENRFVAVGQGATYSSPDGAKWTRQPNTDPPQAVAYGKGLFVGLNWKGRILVSSDALKWEQVYKAEHNLEAICFGGE